jgi:Domain of unknown function (DUF4124)
MLRLLPVTATGLILLGTLGVARADVYRWVDEKGVPHYSDQWVPGSTVIKTDKLHPNQLAAARSEQKSLAGESQNISKDLSAQNNARAMQEEKAAKQQAQCKEARDHYMQAIEARRIYKGEKNGEREYLSDPEADAYRAKMRKDVQDLCGSVPSFNPETPLNPQPQPIPEPKVNPALATSE